MPAGEVTQDANVTNVTGFKELSTERLLQEAKPILHRRQLYPWCVEQILIPFTINMKTNFITGLLIVSSLFSAPVGILTLCNAIILGIMCRRRHSIVFKQSRSAGSENGVSSVMTIRVMLLSFVQCVSVGPWSVAALIPGVLPEIKAVDTVFVDRIFTVLVLIWYLNNCVNYILYSLF